MGSPDHATKTTGETKSTQGAARVQGTEIDDSAPIDKSKDAEHVAISESTPATALAEEEEEEAEDEGNLEAVSLPPSCFRSAGNCVQG